MARGTIFRLPGAEIRIRDADPINLRRAAGKALLHPVREYQVEARRLIMRISRNSRKTGPFVRVAMSDHASMIVLPSLLASVRKAATHIKLEVFTSGAETYQDVASGRINTYLCAEEAPFPRVRNALYLRFCLSCWRGSAGSCSSSYAETISGISARPGRDTEGQQALVDRTLSQLGANHLACTLPFFVPAIFAIAQTDLILTAPRRLAKITAVMTGVRVAEAPREIKCFPYLITWHPRLTNEPAHK
jgi:DNA-binding transcriptional LysR family regulator